MNDITLVSKEYTESVFVTGPELDSKLSPLASKEYVSEFISGPLLLKQDKLTAGDNIKIENNVISATGGGSSTNWQPCDQVIWDIIPAIEPLQTITTAPFPFDLQANVYTGFPVAGRMEITHIIVPRLSIDKSGYYIGYSKKSAVDAYKENHKMEDFWAVTSKPCNIENDGESTYIYNVECKVNNTGILGDISDDFGPDGAWTGWLDASKPSFNTKIAYYSKTTDENGEEIYVYEGDVPQQPFPFYNGDRTKAWSNNPHFNPEYPVISGTIMLRSNLYPNNDIACGFRFVFHPDLSWPKDHPVATKPTE